MIKAQVVGQVWATKRIDRLPQGALLEVEIDSGGKLVAFDPLGCGNGEQVLVAQGSVAAAFFEQNNAVVDAVIIGSLDEPS